MSCYTCSKSYGFFCKEVGCPNCGFSFCTKCLKKTIEVPKCGNAVRKVCLSCHEKLLIKNEQIAKSVSSSKTESKQKANISVLDEPIPEAENLPDVDEEIKKRLLIVKQPNEPVTDELSDLDIAKRLANLKGMSYKEHDNKALIHAVDKRSEQEKTNDLIKQFVNETEIDAAAMPSTSEDDDPIKIIERRLALLKGTPISGDETKNKIKDVEVEDDETMTKNIIKKYLEEAALPDSDLTPEEKEFVNNIKPEGDTEELPWCTICNEDAVIRCIGCDGDLFCRPCFKEIHDNDEEYREHQTKKFVPKPDEH